MADLEAALSADDLLQSLAFARAENRRYKVLIHQKVKNGTVLDEDEKKVINSSHTLFLVIYFVSPNILHLLYSFISYICFNYVTQYYVGWEKAVRNTQKLNIRIIQKIKGGSLHYSDLTAADYITIKHLVTFLSSSASLRERQWDRHLSSAVSYQLRTIWTPTHAK